MIDGGAVLYPATMLNMHPATVAPLYKPSDLPASQESRVSTVSSTFSAPQLPSSSSTLSTSTTTDTESTTPPLSQTPLVQEHPPPDIPVPAVPPSPNRARAQSQGHAQDALLRPDAANVLQTGDTAASPMSLASPTTHGFKRTADGSVKGVERVESSEESAAKHAMGHKKSKSTDTSRIGELSAQLKTRLSYAMVKVQNGWEKQSLEELEEQTSQQGSPISTISRSNASRPTFDSPLGTDRRRRPSGVSEQSDHIIMSPNQSTPTDPSRSHATPPPLYWRPSTKPAMNAAVNLITVTGSNTTPMLGPAPDLTSSRRKRRSSASHHPPPLLGSTQRRHYSDLSGTPRTPATPRAGILRMPSQQAEKDAVDTLLFMSSPNNSGRVPHSSAADGPPLQHHKPVVGTPRRVMFEGHPAPGVSKSASRDMYRQPQSAPSGQPVAATAATAYYHRAESSR